MFVEGGAFCPSRAVMIRIRPGTDLIAGIEAACERSTIRSGSIPCCAGSLRKACFMFLVPHENRMGAASCGPATLQGPVKILSAQGTVGEEEDRAPLVHLHGCSSGRKGRVHGGHYANKKAE